MYSTNNEGKSVITERLIRTLKKGNLQIHDFNIKNVNIDKLDRIVNKYNNTDYSTIKMKPVDVKSSTYIDSSEEINNDDPRFKIGAIVRISKYKNIFPKDYVRNWSEEFFAITKVKSTVPWTYAISYLNGKEIVGTF